jgi:ferric-dicitrate binding protein FerR (iron transport regulator)
VNRDPSSSIESLLKLAGQRDQPSAEALERAREAAHESWRRALAQSSSTPRRPRRLFLLAAAAVLVAATSVLFWLRDPAPVIAVGRIVALQGEVRDDAGRMLTLDARVLVGHELRTGDGRVAITIGDSLSLRVNRATRLRFDAPGRVTLLAGGIYVDSGGLVAKTSLSIATPAGDVRHVGTQFQVQVQPDATRVRVREGRVLLTRPDGPALDLGLGDVASITGSQVNVEHGAATFGDAWEWATATAPAFDIENRPMSEFLAWLAREHGWQLRFEDAGMQSRLREVRLHGSMAGLEQREMLARVALITGIPLNAKDGVLWVGQGEPR